MRVSATCVLTLGVVLAVAIPGRLVADNYEGFDGNNVWGPDPNYWSMTGITGVATSPPPLLAGFDANYSWEIDNPQWWVY